MSRRPNILWICTDQQRWDTLSYFGFPGARTPQIDRLARSGTAFSRAYCQSPICTPSRASFLTGMYPVAHQVHRNGNAGFPEHLPLISRTVKRAGYRTGLVGKLHLSRARGMVEKRPHDDYDEFYWSHHPDPDWETGHDYNDWLREKGVDPVALFADQKGALRDGVPPEYHQTTWAFERSRDFISRNRDRPWFLSVNLFDPHPPFDPPRAYMDRIDPDSVPMPVFDQRDMAQHAKLAGRVDQQATQVINPYAPPPEETAGSDGADHSRPPATMDMRRMRAAYHAMILQIDDMVGGLLDHLEQTGQREDTLVIFMSDHGEMLGDHGLLYKGCRFYEGLVHVPLVVSMPGTVRAESTADALVELVDLPQTILDFAGLPEDARMQGHSLYPLLTGTGGAPDRDFVIAEYFDAIAFPGSVGSRGSMYFDGRYKLCVYHDADTGELFDLETDPHEHVDLWDTPGMEALRDRLLAAHFNAMMLRTGRGPERTADY